MGREPGERTEVATMSDSGLVVASQELEPAPRRMWLRLAYFLLAAAALWLLAGLLHSSPAAAEAPPPAPPVAAALGPVDRIPSPVLSRPAHRVPAKSLPAKSLPAAPVREAVLGVANNLPATGTDVAEALHTVVNATAQHVVRPVVDQIVAPILKPILEPVIKLVPPVVSPLPPLAGLDPITANSAPTAEHATWPRAESNRGPADRAVSAASSAVSASGLISDQAPALSIAPREARTGLRVPAGTSIATTPTIPSQPDRVPTPPVPSGSVTLSAQSDGPLTFINVDAVVGTRLEATGRARLATQAANPKNTAADPAFSPD
jgi:hypothetical protein